MLKFPISCFNDSFWELLRMAVTWPAWPLPSQPRSEPHSPVNCGKRPGNQQH